MVWIRSCCKKKDAVLSTRDDSNSGWLHKKGQKAPESLLPKARLPEGNGSNNIRQNDDMRPSTSDGTYDTVDTIAPMSRQEREQEELNQRRRIIQKQRDRIIGLRHAATCTHDDISDGPCPISSECAEMKQVWYHISNCSDPNCRVPKCISSRYIVSHYHNCNDARCEVCTSVRSTKMREQQLQQQQQQQDADEVPLRRGGTISFGSSTHAISCLTIDSTLSNTSAKSAKISASHKTFETSYRSLALVKIEEE